MKTPSARKTGYAFRSSAQRIVNKCRSFLLASLTAFLATSLPAGEISFKSAEWDSLAIPLQITPFYVQIDSPLQVKAVSLEMDLYVKGTFKRTISSGGLRWDEKPSPLALKAALYFPQPKEGKISGSCVLEWNDSRGVSQFEVKEEELPLARGIGSGSLETKISSPGRTPIFRIVAGGGSVSFPADPMDTAADNPNSTVLIGYLKTE